MPSNIDLVTSDGIYHGLCVLFWILEKIFEKMNTCDKPDQNCTHDWTPHGERIEIKFWKLMQTTWWTNRIVYSDWASWKNRFICRKRSKCLLFTILWTRPFEERGRLKVVCFTDMASTILSEQCYKYRK